MFGGRGRHDIIVDEFGVALPDGTRRDFDLAEVKRRAKARKAQERWDKTEAGFTAPDGSKVATDKGTRDTLAQCILAIDQGIKTEPFSYKGPNGWVSLTRADIIAASAAIGAYVQSCFDAERAACEAIDAAQTREEVVAI